LPVDGLAPLPVTTVVSKQLLPVLRQADDLLSALDADAGRNPDILMISTPQTSAVPALLATKRDRLALSYATQETPRGLRTRSSSSRLYRFDSVALVLAITFSTATGCRACCRRLLPQEGRDRFAMSSTRPSNMGWSSSITPAARSRLKKSRNSQVQRSRHRAIFYDNDVLRSHPASSRQRARDRDHRRQQGLSRSRHLYVEVLGRALPARYWHAFLAGQASHSSRSWSSVRACASPARENRAAAGYISLEAFEKVAKRPRKAAMANI